MSKDKMGADIAKRTQDNLFIFLKSLKFIWSTNPWPYRMNKVIEKFVQIDDLDGFSLVADAHAYDLFSKSIESDIQGLSSKKINQICLKMVWGELDKTFDLDELNPQKGEDIDLRSRINSKETINFLSKLIDKLKCGRADYQVYFGIAGITKFEFESEILPFDIYSYDDFSKMIDDMHVDEKLPEKDLADHINRTLSFSDHVIRFNLFGDEHYVSDEGFRLANLFASLIVAFHKENIASLSYVNQILVGNKVLVYDPAVPNFLVSNRSEYQINADGITEDINEVWSRLSSKKAMDNQLKKAITTYGDACKISLISWKFVILVAALELLLIGENEYQGKSNLFSERGSIILYDNLKAKDKLSYLYKIRNKFIHGNKIIQEKDLIILDRVTKDIIYRLFNLNFSTFDDLRNYCNKISVVEQKKLNPFYLKFYNLSLLQ